jgi:hypothetical protein
MKAMTGNNYLRNYKTQSGNIALNKLCADFRQLSFVSTACLRITLRLKEIKKRRALRGNQRVELLTNSVGKRTVVVLNPSFFYFFNPFFVTSNAMTTVQPSTDSAKNGRQNANASQN